MTNHNYFFDVNLVLDLLLKREPFYPLATRIYNELIKAGKTILISSASVAQIDYLVAKALNIAFRKKKVRILTSESSPDEDFDFLIVPAWQLDKLSFRDFDIGINIESLQEMNQELVDYYLNYFDDVVKDDGLIYLVNSREYRFKGTWNIPGNWQCLLRHRTPRSWTTNHPAEIFRKTKFNQSPQNILRTAFFNQELGYLRRVGLRS